MKFQLSFVLFPSGGGGMTALQIEPNVPGWVTITKSVYWRHRPTTYLTKIGRAKTPNQVSDDMRRRIMGQPGSLCLISAISQY